LHFIKSSNPTFNAGYCIEPDDFQKMTLVRKCNIKVFSRASPPHPIPHPTFKINQGRKKLHSVCQHHVPVSLLRRKDEKKVCVKISGECKNARRLFPGAAVDHGQLLDLSTTTKANSPLTIFCFCLCLCLYQGHNIH